MKQQLLFLCLSFFFFNVNAQLTVDCEAGPLTENYCYSNSSSNSFTYTSTDGTPLILTINSGNVESDYDELVILDSDGTTNLNAANPYGNSGNISGLTFQSTGDTITFSITADSSVSCAAGNVSLTDGITYTVSCMTCINPMVTFEAVPDCNNGNQFLVEVDISSIGDASSLTISNGINSNTTTVNQIGVYLVGPFTIGTSVVVNVSNDDDVNCVVESPPLTILFCPPPNDNPCDAEVLTVNDSSCDVISSGTIYGATNSGITNGACNGNPNDDVWYQFTAIYDVMQISIYNITGGTTNLDHSLFTGTCDGLTEIYCSNDTGNATPLLTIGTDYYVRVFSAGTVAETSSFDICIRNAPTNIVCEQATAFCAQGDEFVTDNIIGISGDNEIACLSSAPNPSWNIVQIGESGTIHMEINQVDVNGNGIDVDFVLWGPYSSVDVACSNIDLMGCPSCPNNTADPSFYPFNDIVDCSYSSSSIEHFTIDNAQSGEIYILLVTNYSYQQGTIIISQTNSDDSDAGTIVGDFEIDLGPDQNLCNETPTTILNADSPFADTYEWYRDATVIEGATDPTLIVTESGNYSVLAYNENCESVAMDDVMVTFIDCENAGLIHINAFFDTNANSVYDAGEINFTNGYFTYEINSNGNINYVSSSTGSFTLASFEDTNSFNFNYYFYDVYLDCFNVSVASFDNVSVSNGAEITIDFPVVDDQPCDDIAVYLINPGPPRPGFNYTNNLLIKNLGLSSTSGSIDFDLDTDVTLNAVSTNSSYTVTITTTGFTLNFVDLPPDFVLNAQVSLYCPNTVPIGELVTNTATLTTTENDTVEENNSSSLTDIVIGSYDPNDIMESHGPQIVYDDFVASDGYLYYTIRFQNIGTAEAIDVRIDDVLDSQLDESTFQMLRSSHDYVVTRTVNQLVWQFDNINLPSESMDAEGSNGFVYFKIKPHAGYGIGDIIPNVADIYFDFNEAITTNTFNTEFVQTLSVHDYDSARFSIYPNPANDVINIQMNGSFIGTFNVEVFDVQGKHVLSKASVNESTMQLNVSSLESGLYFIKMKTESNETIKKLIVN